MKADATFGIIGAMESEIAQLRDALSHRETVEFSGVVFHCGLLGRRNVVLVRCGVGKVNAARCAQILIDRFNVNYLINTGIAGGVGEGLRVADVVVGTELVQYDFDVSAIGYARGNLCDATQRDALTVFRSDSALIETFRAAAESLVDPARVKTGRIATGDRFVASAAEKRALAEDFGAVAAEMEGCAVAQTAAAAGVPFIVLRAISDLADGSALESFQAFEQAAAELSAAILRKLIEGG